MLARISAVLTELEATHGIRILYAAEAGSRAWGFPSPHSDYDVRFIYCHPAAWYLTLDDEADTLNFPVEALLDLGGWELRKTLRLLRASNAALFEWLQSPIVYHQVPDFAAGLAPLLPRAFNLRAGLHHYLGLVRKGLETDLATGQVRLKRLFYMLRPALAVRWIFERHSLPPMQFDALCVLLPTELAAEVQELLRVKSQADEKAAVVPSAALVAFLHAEYAVGSTLRDTLPALPGPPPTPELNALFQHWLAASFPISQPTPGAFY
ncbi:nucleotidyltransferase domain-containing protein [Hymenobacter sp. BT635]|uniref:Nucleotidyltransferase domain-containing protein n=1 Tax=Hymenobacter nitidus TaxID=2880929 RepID=A0ABS8A9H0_9BACT|nr:nucleotidyltransferase domain-containing protein [Hymenobacter nitidus]MCB2377043.1 nucleotidyltransferase domain-containing protein [Hymenobacter nitidus]